MIRVHVKIIKEPQSKTVKVFLCTYQRNIENTIGNKHQTYCISRTDFHCTSTTIDPAIVVTVQMPETFKHLSESGQKLRVTQSDTL